MIFTSLSLAVSPALPAASQETQSFYVSTAGDDSWSGRLDGPTADGSVPAGFE